MRWTATIGAVVALACAVPLVAPAVVLADDAALTEYVPLLPGADGAVNPARPAGAGEGGRDATAGGAAGGSTAPPRAGEQLGPAAESALSAADPTARSALRRLITEPALGAPPRDPLPVGQQGEESSPQVPEPSVASAVATAAGGVSTLGWAVALLAATGVGAALALRFGRGDVA